MAHGLVAPTVHWPFEGEWGVPGGMDWRGVRRGCQVYAEVVAPCHSLSYLRFRDFQYFMTVKEIKELAAGFETEDGVDAQGQPKIRPCIPLDHWPPPYKNKEEAVAVNGAEPPEFFELCYSKAENGGVDYVYAITQGYTDVPAGIEPLPAGKYWNRYFPGGVISMPPPLRDGMVDYEDGTPATVPQMAKDITTFVAWAQMKRWDEVSAWLFKAHLFLGMWFTVTYWYLRRSRAAEYHGRMQWFKPLKYLKVRV
eukprot:TRINITY_DN30719_c0_g2_i1.p1 TRINITY_DN30719_c0_g2~~TRINITY_DN30719_c0_g2_i1.p1  ORF type:complete len:263 (+),score=32.69 TRINITY_DN30719_c0_g2_i1:33-791(+)